MHEDTNAIPGKIAARRRVAATVRAIHATAAGGPDVLELVDLPDPEPAADEVLVRVAAAGVNFIDTYRRSGVYPMPFPHVVGSEGAGEVVAVGADVTEIAVGDRVAWSSAPGSYAELVTVRESQGAARPRRGAPTRSPPPSRCRA